MLNVSLPTLVSRALAAGVAGPRLSPASTAADAVNSCLLLLLLPWSELDGQELSWCWDLVAVLSPCEVLAATWLSLLSAVLLMLGVQC